MIVNPKELSEYPWYLRQLFKRQQKKIGVILIPTLMWGRIPFLYFLFQLFWSYLDRKKSGLDPVFRSIIQVKTAQMNSCHFCIDYNSVIFAKRTDSFKKIDFLDDYKKNSIYSDKERVGIEYAEILSDKNINVPSVLVSKLKDCFSDDELVELTALISFQNMSAKFNSGLGIPSQGLCVPPKNNQTSN